MVHVEHLGSTAIVSSVKSGFGTDLDKSTGVANSPIGVASVDGKTVKTAVMVSIMKTLRLSWYDS